MFMVFSNINKYIRKIIHTVKYIAYNVKHNMEKRIMIVINPPEYKILLLEKASMIM